MLMVDVAVETPWSAASAGQSAVDIAKRALQVAKLSGYDVVILDTAGRTTLDEQMMSEAAQIAQIAGVPMRHEPDLGELNHDYLFSVIDEIGFDGWIGCEYNPADATAGGTSRGLSWARGYL